MRGKRENHVDDIDGWVRLELLHVIMSCQQRLLTGSKKGTSGYKQSLTPRWRGPFANDFLTNSTCLASVAWLLCCFSVRSPKHAWIFPRPQVKERANLSCVAGEPLVREQATPTWWRARFQALASLWAWLSDKHAESSSRKMRERKPSWVSKSASASVSVTALRSHLCVAYGLRDKNWSSMWSEA